MDAYGDVGLQRAINEDGNEYVDGPYYKRSVPISDIPIHLPSESQVNWTPNDKLPTGILEFDSKNDEGVIKVCRNCGPQFDALTLVLVNNEAHGDKKFMVEPNFYPILHKFLKDKTHWERNYLFPGCANYQFFLMEWTELILGNYKDILDQANIYGAVAVSRYPYHIAPGVMKAFIELWSPLTNTFHQGGGEMSISFHDLKVIGDLPIFGIPYEKFIPTNEQLSKTDENGKEIYFSTVFELLLIHTKLCIHLGVSNVTWPHWIDYFYQGDATYGAYGEFKVSKIPKHDQKILDMPLKISETASLTVFLAHWLNMYLFYFYFEYFYFMNEDFNIFILPPYFC